jgi:hypothetical protein
MADINRKIRAALETHLSTISGLPDIAYENVPYEPTTGQSFIRVAYMPTLRRPAVRGLNPQQEYRGLLALNVYAPEGSGPAVCEDIVEKLFNAFEATTDIFYDNVTDLILTESEGRLLLESGDSILVENVTRVCIDYAERSIGMTDAPWYLIPVNIGWFIYN